MWKGRTARVEKATGLGNERKLTIARRGSYGCEGEAAACERAMAVEGKEGREGQR